MVSMLPGQQKQNFCVEGKNLQVLHVRKVVPQLSLQGIILLIRFVSDIDQQLNSSIRSSIGAVTKKLKEDKNQSDCQNLQNNLNKIYNKPE